MSDECLLQFVRRIVQWEDNRTYLLSESDGNSEGFVASEQWKSRPLLFMKQNIVRDIYRLQIAALNSQVKFILEVTARTHIELVHEINSSWLIQTKELH